MQKTRAQANGHQGAGKQATQMAPVVGSGRNQAGVDDKKPIGQNGGPEIAPIAWGQQCTVPVAENDGASDQAQNHTAGSDGRKARQQRGRARAGEGR